MSSTLTLRSAAAAARLTLPRSALRSASAASAARSLSSRAAPRFSSGSSSSSSTRSRLATLLMSGSAAAVAAAAVVASAALSSESASAEPAASTARPPPRNITDLLSGDFRTLGLAPCPPLPARAPGWVQSQARDEGFDFRDLAAILDTESHFLYDALSGERRLTEFYYFCEKVHLRPGGGGEPEPEPIAQGLDFAITTPGAAPATGPAAAVAAKPTQPQPQAQSWSSWIGSFFRSGAAPAKAAATAAPPAPTAASGAKAFSTFDSSPPLVLTAAGPEVRAIFFVGSALCGHKGIVHGGLTAALMDDVSGAATFCAAGGGHFTANLNINYMRPVRADRYVLVRAQAVKQDGRKTYVNISVEDGTGGIFARGTALYVKPKMMPASVFVAATH